MDVRSKEVSTWLAVPAEKGGGGGIWGWGGSAWSTSLERLFVATGNAFEGGSNTGADFSEAAGYGENVVSLSPDLKVAGASHPASIDQPLDLDFAGSPVVFDRAGCGELVVAHDKNAQLFGWRADDLDAGPLWTIDLEPFDPANPLLSQPAYDAARKAVFVVTGAHLVRVDIGADCSAKRVWSQALGTDSLNGSPTIAGGTLWFARSGTPGLAAVDTATGSRTGLLPLPGLTVTAPTILDGRIFVGTFTGQLVGYAAPRASSVPPGPEAPAVAGHASWVDARHGWVSRETGVYSTDDGGGHWRRIFEQPATTVVRTSVRSGIIRVATVAPGLRLRLQPLDDRWRTPLEDDAGDRRRAARPGWVALLAEDGRRRDRAGHPLAAEGADPVAHGRSGGHGQDRLRDPGSRRRRRPGEGGVRAGRLDRGLATGEGERVAGASAPARDAHRPVAAELRRVTDRRGDGLRRGPDRARALVVGRGSGLGAPSELGLGHPQRGELTPPEQREHPRHRRGRRDERQRVAGAAELPGGLVEHPQAGDVDELEVAEIELDVLAALGLLGELAGEQVDARHVDLAVQREATGAGVLEHEVRRSGRHSGLPPFAP